MTNKKVINAHTAEEDGIIFKSRLERRAYIIFKESGLSVNAKPNKIVLMESFKPTTPFMKKLGKELKCDNTKVRAITYTPDFTIEHKGYTFYIETKGFKTDSYNIKVKLFRRWLESQSNSVFAEIKTLREVNELVRIISEY